MTSELKNLLEATNAHPFLFVGSGFSHRYLGTADWKGLVSQFASQSKPETAFAFEWYKNIIGVRHKLLIFNHANHAFESSKRKNLSRILTHWVWRSCRSFIARGCRREKRVRPTYLYILSFPSTHHPLFRRSLSAVQTLFAAPH